MTRFCLAHHLWTSLYTITQLDETNSQITEAFQSFHTKTNQVKVVIRKIDHLNDWVLTIDQLPYFKNKSWSVNKTHIFTWFNVKTSALLTIL